MLQKIFLGMIAVSLVVMIILFIPVFRYYNIEVTNTNLFEEVEEKRNELEELTEEALIAKARIDVLAQQLAVYSFYDKEENDNLREKIIIALDARTYIYENFAEGVENHLDNFTMQSMINTVRFNENLDNYEELLEENLKNRYLALINSTVRSMAQDYFESIDFFEDLRPEEYEARHRVYRGFVNTMMLDNYDTDLYSDYIKLYLVRNVYENMILTAEQAEELRQNVANNYRRFLEDKDLVGWYERVE